MIARLALIAALALAALPTATEARLWRVVPGASELGLVYTVDGAETRGAFARFVGAARFDPKALERAEMTLTVDAASIDVGDPFGTEIVKSIDWLYVEAHPIVRYELVEMTRIGRDRYRARGVLTLRSAARDVFGELTVKVDADQATAVGEARFDRKDFGVGVGFSTLFVDIGPEIVVSFRLTATPAD